FFFSSRRRHTRSDRDWSSDVCSSDLSTKRFCHSTERLSRSSERHCHSTKRVRQTTNRICDEGNPIKLMFLSGSCSGTRRRTRKQIGRASCREREEREGGDVGVERE